MHVDLIKSGLSKEFHIGDQAIINGLEHFLNKEVKYKNDIVERRREFGYGTIIGEETFLIREVQLNYRGIPQLRGYAQSYNDTFGRVIDPGHVEVIQS